MLNSLHIVRESATRVAEAAERTVSNIDGGQLQQEPAFTDRMLGRIEEAMDGYIVKGVRWKAMTLTDRGPGAQESRFGADFLAVLDISVSGFSVKKGILVQAKMVEPDDSFNQAEFDRMVSECKKMLRMSPDSFVFLYGRAGIKVVPALSVLGLSSRTNPHELYQRSCQRFFEEHFESFIGDASLHTANITTLDDLKRNADEAGARSALLLKARPT
jgi:hypothetical protein